MEFKDLIQKRTCIRAYKGTPVTAQQLQALLEAAIMAPNACNFQSWRFYAVTNKEKINAFQMDDYIGIREDAPQRFANFLNRAVFERVSLRSVMLLKCDNYADNEIARYSALLRAHPLDVAFIGIGENGHIAFNDPDIADFFDHEDIKRVKMAYESRQQQVNDGCFASLEDVPHEALTVTIPVILRAKRVFCIVPCHTKAQAVHDALVEKISTDCPASILRLHSNAALYLDGESASRL